MKKTFILLICILIASLAFAQQDSMTLVNTKTKDILVSNPKPVRPQDASPESSKFITSLEFILSLSVLIFGLIIVILEIYLVRTKEIGPDMLVKFIIITLIITGTLFLITAGYNNDQIAPAVGLFGTVAGYLLGKSNSIKNTNEST